MSTLPSTGNKQLMRFIFTELAQGNGRPFVDAMADNFCWILTGQTAWSRRYEGKQVVREQLFKPLFAQFAGTYVNRATRFVAEDDMVVVECRGEVTTHKGRSYNNQYCYVCRLADGKLVELVEYLDTQLVDTALDAPA
ncbi:MAG: nuclear transport factor 2 family protein [Polaromonas sp.]|uniref:nuclear transport factor 2 family protein n=1 Tax=Polaromonas sp. TaxID=1869339 RepID=UPI0017ADEFA8|nr:nuclear transport factor 2 family protein [Polaromonas sp.]MBA3594505.1 nuclear transport factor 2 family protein [Polaromonas sp.]